MRAFLQTLQTQAWRTMGARYNAARRLKRRDWIATFSIAIFSAIGIALAVVQKVYVHTGTPDLDNYITVFSVCIGLFVLVISLIEWGTSGSVKADALYRNAELLNRHQRKIGQILAESGEPSDVVATDLREAYEAIKESCSYNHEPVDDLLFQAQQRLSKEFRDDGKKDGKPKMNWIEGKWAVLMDQWSSAKTFLAFWLVIIVLVVAMPWGR
ncbi:MAG: SLATT domain-containing protein [Rhodoferax sp.]|nr:SLATT domain-containing protein [Rhodoferax sp.]MDP3654055.1 SLATT domain-containing protein [Rhodoferax sp.]